MATEEPKFKLIEQEGQFEIREYRSKIIAEVFVEGNMSEASSKGFRLIADYIFGNNKTTSGNAEKISMTAPVSVAEEDKGWRVYFIMPEKYTLTTLPKPNNPQVHIRELDGKTIAVHQFSGIATESKFQDKFTSLSDWLTKKHLKAKGRPELARYNPPWTLPFFRRNEVMVELEQ